MPADWAALISEELDAGQFLQLEKNVSAAYEKFGFEYLTGPMGNTGHHGCSVWMCKSL